MQKYLIAFSLNLFLESKCTKNPKGFSSKFRHSIARNLNNNLFNSNKTFTSPEYIRRFAKNIFRDSYTHLSTAQKHFYKAGNVSFSTYGNLSFTAYKNVEEYAEGMHPYSGAFAINLSRAMRAIVRPVEAEALSTIRLSAIQSVASS